jgi:hypothetical protein
MTYTDNCPKLKIAVPDTISYYIEIYRLKTCESREHVGQAPRQRGRGETLGVTLSLRTGWWCCLWRLRQYGKSGRAR